MSFMELKYQLVIAGILLFVGWGVGYYMGSGIMPEPVTKTVTKYVPQFKPKDLGKEYSLPNKQLYYKPIFIKQLRVDTVYIPKKLKNYNIISNSPINISPSKIELTYFNPKLKRYEQEIFSVPKRAFDWNVYVSNLYRFDLQEHYVGLEGDVRFKRVGLSVGGLYSFTNNFYYYAGLRIKIN